MLYSGILLRAVAGLDLVRLVVGAAFLGVAAVSDLRERKVKDELWIVMAAAAAGFFAFDLWTQGVRPAVGLVLVPTVILLFDPLVDTLLGRKDETEGGRGEER